MIKEALNYLFNQGIKPADRVVGVEEGNFLVDNEGVGHRLRPIKENRADAALHIHTLTGLVDYIKTKERKEELYVHVVSESKVRLVGTLDIEGEREELAIATAKVPSIDFGYFMNTEQLIIMLQSSFVANEDRSVLLKVVGNTREENVREASDDGVSQKVAIRNGVASTVEVKVPNPVTLAPYRTFLEVAQPESDFIFRMQEGPKGGLFEADGGMWRNEAILAIRDYLIKELEDVADIHIIA